MTIDLTPPAFDPTDWANFVFSHLEGVEVGIFNDQGDLAGTFTADRARALGLLLIELATEISTMQATEKGQAIGLAAVLAENEVERTDQVYVAMMRRRVRADLNKLADEDFGPEHADSQRAPVTPIG